MPLEVYCRGKLWWVRGRIEYNGTDITDYYRRSTGALTEEGARRWCGQEEDRQRRRYIVGPEAERLTVNDAILEYDAKPNEAAKLTKIITERPDVGEMSLDTITGKFLRNLGKELFPNTATDTMWRQVVTPIRAVINNMHDLGKGPHIAVKAYSERERVDQDVKRGKLSRVEKEPSDKDWIEAFCKNADAHNAALARFMFETAARIGQAVAIMPHDLDLMNFKVRLKASKGHPEQWVTISRDMMIELANLPPKRPQNRKTNKMMEARVFGYATNTGYRKRWETICKRAGIKMLTAHSAGRHGFYTELRVRQGVDPITAATMGRWKDASLPDRIYAHVVADEASVRERFRTEQVQSPEANKLKYMK